MTAEYGMRNAGRTTGEPRHTQRYVLYSTFVHAFGRATAALAFILAAPTSIVALKAAERETEVAVRTVEAQPITGKLVTFSLQDGAVVRTNTEKVQIAIADIIRISSTTRGSWSEVGGVWQLTTPQDTTGNPSAVKRWSEATGREAAGLPDPELWTITFPWGDVLCGRVIGASGDTVVMKTADLGELPIPIDAMGRIASSRAAQGAHRKSLQWLDRGRSTDDDRVLLTNGDLLRGFISAIDADGITIDAGTGPTKAPFRLVVAARMAHAPSIATPPPYAIVTLRDESRLTATGLDWRDGVVEAKLRTGTTVHFDADGVIAVDLVGGRWEWLSDDSSTSILERRGHGSPSITGRHQPLSYEQAPMLGLGWDYIVGRNVLNGPIIVNGESYERGIGVHSRSNLVFELNGRYREFVTSFGLDDDSGPLADVTVLVLVDGQRRFEKAHVRRGSILGPIRVDVSHAGRIELVVEYGDNGDIQDRFDWIEPGLIR